MATRKAERTALCLLFASATGIAAIVVQGHSLEAGETVSHRRTMARNSMIRPLSVRDGSALTEYASLPDDDVRYVTAVYVRGSLDAFTKVRVRVFPTHFEETLRLDDPHLK